MAQILVAEDDDSMRSFLAGALRRAGHAVETASDGFEALSCLARHKYDVLLADVVMPGMDGVELARRASRDQPQIKVMFITGFAAVALARPQRHARRPEDSQQALPFEGLGQPDRSAAGAASARRRLK